ncbi:MAG: response regulator transcription factor [Chloroflexi bacterium]|nr:response regulator transcription factor [Chloroflexota bacterium]
MRQVVLVVDDEAPMRKYISSNLRARGYDVLTAEDGAEALKLIGERPIDLLILDIMMPGPDGLEVLQAVRRDMDIPVVMLSARGREGDKVEALDLGADDYLTKPFGVAELLARVRAALRRATSSPKGPLPPYRAGALEVDFGARRVLVGGREVSLTPKEYEVLAYLARNAGRVLTHRQVLQAVWGSEYGDEADYVWTYVRRIRRKIEPDPAEPRYLLTEAGVGYRVPKADEG